MKQVIVIKLYCDKIKGEVERECLQKDLTKLLLKYEFYNIDFI